MENYYEKLKELFQGQNPDKVQQVLGNTPLAPVAPQLTMPSTNLNIPDANSIPSSFDVNTSDNTVTQNGNMSSIPAPTTPPDMNSQATPTPPPSASMPKVTPKQAESGDEEEDENSVDPDLSNKDVIQGLATSNDDAQRKAMLDELNKRRKLNILPMALAQASDAVAGAASAFGANVSQGHAKAEGEREEKDTAEAKQQFEDKLRHDPNSDISKQYQGLLSKFLQKDPNDPMIQGRSAAQIAEQIPAIEKLAAMQNQKDMKELQLKQIQANKEMQMTMMNANRQDKLEKETREWVDNLTKARNGQIGQQDAKVNGSIHLLNLMDQYKDKNGNYNIPNSQYAELALGLANVISPTGQASEGTRREIESRTAKGDLNGALTYLGFDPKTLGGSTQSVFQNLRHSIERQGTVSEDLRNNYLDQQKATAPSGLNKDQRDRLLNQTFGNSVKDYISQHGGQVPTAGGNAAPVTKTIGGKTYIQKDGKWYTQ